MNKAIGLDINNGLANRMRVLDCFLDLADRHDRRIVLYWPKEFALYVDFEELFEIPERFIKIVSFDLLHSRTHRYVRRIFNWLVYLLYSRVYQQKEIEYLAKTKKYQSILKKRKPFIRTVTRLYIPDKPYAFLTPVKELRDEIDKFTSRFDDNVVGVHIRQGDNYAAKQMSPLSLFISRIQAELETNENIRFFLATDDPGIRDQLKKEFPDKLLLRETSSFARNEASGIKDALVDIYCLSRTRKIFGSFHSSFSEEAALLGGIRLEVIKL